MEDKDFDKIAKDCPWCNYRDWNDGTNSRSCYALRSRGWGVQDCIEKDCAILYFLKIRKSITHDTE